MALVNEINRHRRDFGIGCSGLLKRVHNIVLYTGEAGIFGSLSIVGVGFVKIQPQFYEKGPFYV